MGLISSSKFLPFRILQLVRFGYNLMAPVDYKNKACFIIILLIALYSCNHKEVVKEFPSPNLPQNVKSEFAWDSLLTRDVYHDKVLGMLVGSAIGDAMGAPTEMWPRTEIEIQKGFVRTLDPVIREGSPEGPWEYNLPPGGTTDDTRWKYLFAQYVSHYKTTPASLDPYDFAQFITDLYLAEKDQVGKDDAFAPDELETQMRHMTWLQEWAKVAKPYLDGDLDGYSYAVNKFYGGEMACAGMLYAPMVGLYYPADPAKSYKEAFALGIFDLGYARDITGLTAAYLSQAMQPGTSLDLIGRVTENTDPNGYFKSRLVGRIAHRIFQDAKRIVHTATRSDIGQDIHGVPPENYPYEMSDFIAMKEAYRMLDSKLQDIPFHAGEIHLINLTALEFGRGDFRKTIEFVINYGRDNDTVAAVTGAILGAYLGAESLPGDLYNQTLKTNQALGIDLEKLADQIVTSAFQGL